MSALTTEKLCIRNGKFEIRNVDLLLEEGQTGVLTGKSGSGKSTLIYAIGGAIPPESGYIYYGGRQMYEAEREIRKEMSLVYAQPNFNTELTPKILGKEIHKFEPWFEGQAFLAGMEQLGVDSAMRVKLLSEEQQRKMMVLMALCRKPKLLVMDEGTTGMEEASRMEIWEMIREYRKNRELTLLCSTHHEEEIAAADHVWNLEENTCHSVG